MTEPIRLDADTARASQALIDAYATSWQRITDAQQQLLDDPLNARKRSRLNELQSMVEREVDGLDDEAKTYVRETYPRIYASAVTAGAEATSPGAAAFTQINQEAASRLATGLYSELLEATTHVGDSTKRLIRQVGRDAALRTAIEGKTAKQAATEMRRVLQAEGIHAVTYANGARMGLKGYAEMAIRTSTALALNEGTLQGSADAGCVYWEIFDGPTCGFRSHDDPEIANGKIVSRDDALAYPIAHPNCRRAVGPRPDLGLDASKAQRSTTPDQDAAQLAQDQARGMPVGRDIARRASGQPPRVPRAAPERSEARIQEAMARRDFPGQRKATAESRRAAAPAAPAPPPTPAPQTASLLDRYADGEGVVKSTAFGEGQVAQVQLLELDDGTKAILKISPTSEEAAAEVAYSRMAREFGAKVPRVERIDGRTVIMDYVEDTRADLDDWDLWGDPDYAPNVSARESIGGQKLGVLDTVWGNSDRHYLNWLVDPEGDVVGIDHGIDVVDFDRPSFGDFTTHAGLQRFDPAKSQHQQMKDGVTDYLEHDWPKAELERIRVGLDASRTELSELRVGPRAQTRGATAYDVLTHNLEELIRHARS